MKPFVVTNIEALVGLRWPSDGAVVRVRSVGWHYQFRRGSDMAVDNSIVFEDCTHTGRWVRQAEAETLRPAAPTRGAVEMIADEINRMRDSELFDPRAALAAIVAVRKNLDLMELEVKRIVARKLPS
jgi:hypothetical protein